MRRIVVMGDLHCGALGGITPQGWFADGDEKPHLRKLQEEMWREYRILARENSEPDILIINGDTIDGNGYRSGGTEQVTTDRLEQCDMAIKAIQQFNAKKILMTYGTGYHTGDGEDFENVIAEKLDAEIHNHLIADIDGVVFDVKHHVGGSSVPHGRHTAVAKEKLWGELWAKNESRSGGDVIIRSHVHYFAYCGGFLGNKQWLGMTLPALQAPAFNKYGGRRCSGTVDWGLVSFEVTEGVYTWNAQVQRLSQAQSKVLKV